MDAYRASVRDKAKDKSVAVIQDADQYLRYPMSPGFPDKPVQTLADTLPHARKDDGDKLDMTLFFDDLPNAIEGVAQVLQWAITKKLPVPYNRGSWQGVPDFQRRYRAAQLRHEISRAKYGINNGPVSPEPTDKETGLLELAHIATDAMFRLEMALRAQGGVKPL